MNIYECVKAAIPPAQSAEHYGLEVSRGGMACCPFHEDAHPSMKLYPNHYYCFGCHATGDVIDLTAKLLGLSNYEAAKRLAADFAIPTGCPTKIPEVTPISPDTHLTGFLAQYILKEAFQLLALYKRKFAPAAMDEPCDERFQMACADLDYVEYMLECLEADPQTTTTELAEARTLDRLMERLDLLEEGRVEYDNAKLA